MPAGGCESRCESQCRGRALADDALGKLDRLPLANRCLRAPSKRLAILLGRHPSSVVGGCNLSNHVALYPLSIVALSSQQLSTATGTPFCNGTTRRRISCETTCGR